MRPVPIMYGYPTGDALRDAQAGKIILGGCQEAPTLADRPASVRRDKESTVDFVNISRL
jgi:hypothetical protein